MASPLELSETYTVSWCKHQPRLPPSRIMWFGGDFYGSKAGEADVRSENPHVVSPDYGNWTHRKTHLCFVFTVTWTFLSPVPSSIRLIKRSAGCNQMKAKAGQRPQHENAPRAGRVMPCWRSLHSQPPWAWKVTHRGHMAPPRLSQS